MTEGPQLKRKWKWRFEKRDRTGPLIQLAALIGGLTGALLISAILIVTAKADIWLAFGSLFRGAFGGWYAFTQTLIQSTPLIFTGLAVLVSFKAKIFNIGAEGQFFAGAMAAFWVSISLAGFPRPVAVLIIVLASLFGGALYGAIPGILKAVLGVNEIIVTVMMNYIIQFILSYMISNHWRDPGDYYLQTAFIPENVRFPMVLPHSRVHLGFLLAVTAAVVIFCFLWKTPSGFEIRALGESRSASRYKGIDTKRIIILVMVISGAIAGLAGGSEIAGVHHRLRLDISTGYGYTGIIIALLGKLHPFGVVAAAVFFGALVNGSTSMQVSAGVPVALVYALQSLVLICVMAAEVLSQYRIRRVYDVE